MRIAAARAIARRRHAGRLDDEGPRGALYVDHLERVAARVAAAGGNHHQRAAAYLHGLMAHEGMDAAALAAAGVSPRVIAIVRALSCDPYLPARERAARIMSRRDAELVARADIADRLDHRAAGGNPTRHDRLLFELDLPALRRDRDAAIRRFLVGLDDASAVVRWRALQGLGRLRAEEAVDPLLAMLDRDPADRGPMIALRRIMTGSGASAWFSGPPPDPRWVPLLHRLIGHDAERVAALAADLLGRLDDAEHAALVVRLLDDPRPAVSAAAVTAAGSGAVRAAAEPLCRIAAGTGAHPSERAMAARALGRIGDGRAIPILAEALCARDGHLAHAAARALVGLAGPEAVAATLGAFDDESCDRAHTAWALGEFRAREAVPALIGALDGAGETARVSIAEALGKIGAPEAAPALAGAVRTGTRLVRCAALRALTRIGPAPAVDACLEAADDPDPQVRRAAIAALARCPDDRATVRLIAACREPHPRVALRAMIDRADPRAVPTLADVLVTTHDRTIRRLAGRALVAAAGPDGAHVGVVRAHLPGIFGPDPVLRRIVAWLYGRLPDLHGAFALRIRLNDPDELFRARAADSLGLLADRDSAPELIEALADPAPRVRASAATALGRLPSSRAIRSALRRSATDPHPDVRSAATAALRRLGARPAL